jgi:DNA gyrase/topoisomerase IV subunit A
MDEINRAVRRSSDRIEARRALRDEPFGYSERVTTHILDLSVSRQTKEGMEELRRERQQAVDRLQKLGE